MTPTLFGNIISIEKLSLYLNNVEIRFDNENIYVGKYVNGKMNGKGIIYYSNEDIFEGTFCNNTFRGPGKLVTTTLDGEHNVTYEGIFDDIYFEGEINYNDGNKFYGKAQIINNVYQGFGQWKKI